MTASIVKPNSTQDQEWSVQLRDLMPRLGYTDHRNLRERFKTFLKKTYAVDAEKVTEWKSLGCFPSDYFDSVSMQFVRTYAMTSENAMAFAMYVDPAKGILVLRALSNAQPEPAPIPYFHAKTCNKRMLAERYNRSISSITTTFERNAKWLVEIGGMEEHMEERDGELWFTEAYASCIAFGGGKVAAQTKAKAMIASYDNQKLSSDTLQMLLQ